MHSPATEQARVAELHSFGVLDTEAEQAFDALALLAAQICNTPSALISLVDTDRQWFKARIAFTASESSREVSFCSHALQQPGLFVVPDSRKDSRFATNPLVTGPPGIRFYAGAPLVTPEGHTLGTLCVLDVVPRTLTALQLSQLEALAAQVMDQLLLRKKAAELANQIAARAASEAALVASEQRWRRLVEESPVALSVIGADGRFKYCNEPAARLYGAHNAAELMQRSAIDLVPEDDHDSTRALFGQVLSGQTVLGKRWTLKPLNKQSLVVELNATLVQYDGSPAMQVELRDMTEVDAGASRLRESESRWRLLTEASPVGIALSDEKGRFLMVNSAACALLGRDAEQILGHSGMEFIHPDEYVVHDEIGQIISAAGDGVARIERRCVRPDGEIRWVWLTLTHTPGPEGQEWTLAHWQDITERKQTEQALLDSEANLIAVAQVVNHIQTGADARGAILDACLKLADALYVALLEPTADGDRLQVTASTSQLILGESITINSQKATAKCFRTGAVVFIPDTQDYPGMSKRQLNLTQAKSVFTVPVRSGGTVTGVLAVGWTHRIPSLDDKRTQVVLMLADHTGLALRQEAMLAELRGLALTDPLTSLPNRRSWDDRVEVLIRVARRSATPLTLALADLDHFKRFNDTHGHLGGDELLQEFARGAVHALRAGDVVARWGGEEFAIALSDCTATEAVVVLDRIRQAMPGRETCSIGYATWNRTETAEQLMQRADEALYAAKSSGRDRVVAAAELVLEH